MLIGDPLSNASSTSRARAIKWSMRGLIHGIADQNDLRTEDVPTETSKEASARTISKAVSYEHRT